ncbi:MAG TPA: four-carbon acid sugar kinase family protein, partial [Methylomirabilota bacterium]|nr:four-carbon acid sugar kinase family protein [Methylomirabilota bacterium]
RVAAAAAAAPARRYFKKIDSTLRGNLGAEVDAAMRATGAAGAVLTPAFPAQGRVVIDRILFVEGRPVAETALGRDPERPRRDSSNVVDRVRPDLDRPLAWIPIDQVRAGPDALNARLRRLRGTVAVADAETDEDLAALVDAALVLDPAPLLIGAAGLAHALAARLGLLPERAPLPSGSRWLVVAGSRHPVTRAQIAAARAAGMRVVASAEAEAPGRAQVAARLAAEARRLLEAEAFDVVAVTGGQTAVALYRALEAERIDLVGAPVPGLALGYMRAPRRPEQALLTKAGGFGAPDLFVSLWRRAAA